jgi:hypothetical protein
MSDESTPIKEYDAKHGNYKAETQEVNTASSVMPPHEKALPFAKTAGNPNASEK